MELSRKTDARHKPKDVCVVHVLGKDSPWESNPSNAYRHFRCGFAIHCRWENGIWTREKRKRLTDGSTLWHWLNNVRRYGVVQHCFGLPLSQSLILTGLLKLMESGEFTLSQTKRPDSKMQKRNDSTSKSVPGESGLMLERGHQLAIVVHQRSKGKFVLCDLRNFIDKTGESISRLVSLPWGREPTEEDSDDDAMIVCMQRCEVMLAAAKKLCEWWNENQLGRLGLTTASCSMSIFKQTDLIRGIEIPECQDVRDLERAGYHAGRTEPLWIGRKTGTAFTPHPLALTRPGLFNECPVGPFYQLDASSFYGWLYRECTLPKSLQYQGFGMNKQQALQLITDDSWLAECRINSKTIKWPYRDTNGSHYATGNFITTLCGPELLRAVQSNCVESIGSFHKYVMDYTLRSFADRLWNERAKAKLDNPVIETWCKQLIAALHGKFAQRATKWLLCPDLRADEAWQPAWQHWSNSDKRWVNYRAIGYEVQQEMPNGDHKEAFPAIAAFVTANGREALAAWERISGHHNTLYLATDSLIVTEQGYRNLEKSGLIDTGDLGSLRVLQKSDTVEIRGHGTYSIGDKLAMQGIQHHKSDLVFGTVSQVKTTGLEYCISHRGLAQILVQGVEAEPGWNYDPIRVGECGWVSPMYIRDNLAAFEDRMRSKSASLQIDTD